jgi:hypothetical protein
MPLPEGWEWLKELAAHEWEPPDELLTPTRYPETNLAIKLLSCESLGLEECSLVGQFISEQMQFTLWYVREGEAKAGGFEQAAWLATFGDTQTRLVYDAWLKYESSRNSTGMNKEVGERVRTSRGELRDVLRKAVTALVEVRSRSDVTQLGGQ